MLIEPTAYYMWGIKQVVRVIPQSAYWILIIVSLIFIVVYITIKSFFQHETTIESTANKKGAIDQLAEYIHHSENSNYFKWVIANHLANLSLSIMDQQNGNINKEPRDISGMNRNPPPQINIYLNAGLNHSFMAYRSKRKIFKKQDVTPFGIELDDVINYLESLLESE